MEYKALELATDYFTESNILGEGGFGCVYLGKLEGNSCVAVKKLFGGNVDSIREFQVLSLSKSHMCVISFTSDVDLPIAIAD